jgi:TetR/AcrR family transcriptional regulator
MPADERRQHLLDVALHLFATRGFSGTTTRSIAAAAGISEAIIFRHFTTKEELYDSILQHKARQVGFERLVGILRRYAERGDDERLVRQLAQKTLQSYQRDADFRRMMLYAALEGHDLAKAAHRTFGQPMFSFLRQYVAARQRAGVFRPGDPDVAVFALVALPIHFSVVNWLFRVAPVKQTPTAKLAEEFTRLILDGLRSPVRSRQSRSTARRP